MLFGKQGFEKVEDKVATGYVSLSTFVTFSSYTSSSCFSIHYTQATATEWNLKRYRLSDLEVKEASFYFIFFLFLAHGIQNFPD